MLVDSAHSILLNQAEMYKPLRAEIQQNIERYQLGIKPLAINQYRGIQQQVFDTFCVPIEPNTQPIWVWSFLKNIEKHEDLDQIDRTKQFQRLIPNYHDRLEVFFFVPDQINGRHKFWWYVGYFLDRNVGWALSTDHLEPWQKDFKLFNLITSDTLHERIIYSLNR